MATPEYGLGRLYVPDERDQRFPATATLDTPPPERRHRYYSAGWRGNQAATPHCVAYSWFHWLGSTGRPGVPDPWDTTHLYREAQKVDQWPGEDYDGTSVRAGAKILQREQLIGAYRWAWNVDTIAAALLTAAPVVVGTAWHKSMFTPDTDGMLHLDGNVVGGHAYLLSGVNVDRAVFRIDNSWGPSYGVRGRAWIGFDDMAALLADHGEACLPTAA